MFIDLNWFLRWEMWPMGLLFIFVFWTNMLYNHSFTLMWTMWPIGLCFQPIQLIHFCNYRYVNVALLELTLICIFLWTDGIICLPIIHEFSFTATTLSRSLCEFLSQHSSKCYLVPTVFPPHPRDQLVSIPQIDSAVLITSVYYM